ncbi:MAG: ribosome biogenesis GTPase YlqF [Glaciimonas sp.]|nr:ribosome biogenesis GTPase YlqF [Glaciimonas sp.]
MSIQWFPGHMNAARKKAAEAMEKVDMIIEVLDARIPQASCNPMIEQLRLFRQRPCLKILNKSDLADPVATKAWISYYNAQKGVNVVALSCKKPSGVLKVPSLALALAPHRGTLLKPLRMMIMGIPNVGKSTLMNALLKKRVAAVGDEPAITKVQQRLYMNQNMVLIDTPGMLWPKITLPSDGMMLAASHAVGVNALIEEEVATYLADVLLQRYPQLVAARYNMEITETTDGVDVIERVANRRGYRLKGSGFDLEKAANTLLQDFRTGALGRIALETPQSRTVSLAQHQQELLEKQQAKDEVIAAVAAEELLYNPPRNVDET